MNNYDKILFKRLALVLTTIVIQVIWAIQPNPAAATIYFDLVIDESRQLLYGSDRDGGKIDFISTDTLAQIAAVNVGSQPTGLDISPDGNELAVALYGQSEIAFIDLTTLVVTDRLVPEGTFGPNRPHDLLYGRPGRLYSVGNPGSSGIDYVHAFDTVNKVEVGRSTKIMRAAPRLAKTVDHNTLYVSQVIFSPQQIYRFDISTDTPVQTAAAPHGPVRVNALAVNPDGSRVYSSRGQVWSGDLTTQLGSFLPAGDEIEYSDTLQRFFITDGFQVIEYDANSYELIHRRPFVGTGGVARVNAAGTMLYVSTDFGIVALDLTAPPPVSQFSWPMFIPAIIGGSCRIASYWGAYTTVCCPNSLLTFSVTISGETKQSTATSCAVESTWAGWEKTTAGTKSVFWQITSPICGTYSGTTSGIMEKGKFYLVQLEAVDGSFVVFVYSGDACSIVQNTQLTKSQSLQENSIGMEAESLQLVNKIKLDIPTDAFKETGCR